MRKNSSTTGALDYKHFKVAIDNYQGPTALFEAHGMLKTFTL